ncbi:cupin domain-containing protein [Hansschlegelia quercus]|uniref:Cupin domain-containing protein n=1 Tax=Hansschlegelia quercus TaxID=2528245 RepID=A0A4Q9GE43_9HYPH|nr:cupin domain-containing protein [Hansschlegelia quercus]TBN48603.1 cupin domain-containing protein [Hansschlegelia quercus]
MSASSVEAAMRLHLLAGAVVEWEESAPPEDRVIEGSPKFRTAVHYEAPDGRLFAGVWEASEGAWRVAYDEWEWCSLRSGRCVVTPDGGEPVPLGPGDPLVLEPGFSGEWRVLEACSKDFVVLLSPPADED